MGNVGDDPVIASGDDDAGLRIKAIGTVNGALVAISGSRDRTVRMPDIRIAEGRRTSVGTMPLRTRWSSGPWGGRPLVVSGM